MNYYSARRGYMVQMRYPERAIEDRLVEHFLAQPDTLTVTRQYKIPGYGILDILVETAHGIDDPTLVTVIECKATPAGMRALQQLHRYLRGIVSIHDSWGIEDYTLAGAIAAPSFTRELRQYEAEAEIRGELFRLYPVPA